MRHMTDSHFHGLAMEGKGIDPAKSIMEARTRGFAEAIEVGLHPLDLQKRKSLLSPVQSIYFTSGLAPAEAKDESWRTEVETLRVQALSGQIVAIGELGLDWHWNYGSKESQIELMSTQFELAKEAHLPVIIHNREADADILKILKRMNLPAAGIMHCFSSDYPTAAACVDMGYMISFAGNVTYKNAEAIQETVARLPIDSILVETDSPFLSPQAVRGTSNTPVYIQHTYRFIANLRGISVGHLVDAVRENLFRTLELNHQE
jgi:TatD DNase family protein